MNLALILLKTEPAHPLFDAVLDIVKFYNVRLGIKFKNICS